jgi:hypothetical protein
MLHRPDWRTEPLRNARWDGVRAWNRAAVRNAVHKRLLCRGVPSLAGFHSPHHSSHQFTPFQTVSMDRFAFPKDHPHRSAQEKVQMDYEIHNGHRSLVLTSVAGFAQLASNNQLNANVPLCFRRVKQHHSRECTMQPERE